MNSFLLLTHICAAVAGLLSGFMAMIFRKGSGLHGAAGSAFSISMVVMASTSAYLATFWKVNMLNLVVSLLVLYMVSTAWVAAKRRQSTTSYFDLIAMLFILGVSMAAMTFGIEAVKSASGTKNGMPAPMYFVFGTIALLFAISDVRMLHRGGVTGAQRIGRHLWRMLLPLFIATMSFFPGQARQFPASWRHTPVVYIPHMILIASMIYWLRHISRRKRAESQRSAADGRAWTAARAA